MDPNIKNINLQLDNVEVLTTGTAAEFVNGILDFLLFQRRQIPFVYKTYKYYVEKWSDEAELNERDSFSHYQLNQQRSRAKATKESISDMRELIRHTFRTSDVKSIRFLFGTNTFMPTESYTLHIPHDSISRHHYCEHHALPEGRINQSLLRLLTCEELYTLFSTELNATNVFLEMELFKDVENTHEKQQETGNWIPKDVLSKLPRSCKNVHLHLLYEHDSAAAELRCCRQLDIYEDLGLLKLDNSEEECDKSRHCGQSSKESSGWWQAEVIVRGFKTPANQKATDLWTS
ncbi:uncharacterized protein [Drosophila bipectinata]|uniref:uncharacterized protein n=1 Tax=Drosophila bipectinata TaxID=42026 RepID=UPI001C8A5B90|nr:uncharacterized protein LOC108129621 [Drosophila bipectinata]